MKTVAGFALKALIGAAAGAMIVGGAHAADLAQPEPVIAAAAPSIFDVAFGVAGVTDYRFRGISNSNKNPAVQGYVELQAFDWLYAGIWSSSVDFPERRGLSDPAAEIDFYGGLRHTWGNFTLDLGGLYYYYPGEQTSGFRGNGAPYTTIQTDYWELSAKPSYSFGDFGSITGNLFWTSDFANSGSNATYLSVIPKINIPVSAFPNLGFYVSGELGKQWLGKSKFNTNPHDYLTWNVGAGLTFKAITLDVRYSDTDLGKNDCVFNTGARSWCGSAVVGKIAFDTSLSKLK